MQISKKFKLAMVLSLALFAGTAQAALSDRCIITIAQSAVAFTEIDAYRNGLSPEEVDADIQKVFMDAEIEAMQQMYSLGAETVSRGATRAQALKFFRDSAKETNADSDLPKDLQQKAAKAAEETFMCGYDDQVKDT